MSLIVKEPEGGGKFPPIEPGTYAGVCYGVVDLGDHYSEMYDKSTRKLMVMWELPYETIETEDGVKPRTISETYSASLAEKATLRKMLEGWRGKVFSSEELKGFDISKLLGVGCNINIIRKEGKEGKSYSKVQAVTLPVKGSAPIVGSLDKVIFDIDTPDAKTKILELPEWIQKRIKESSTWMQREGFEELSPEEADEPLPWET